MKINKHNIEDVFRAKKCSVKTMESKGYELIEDFFVDNSGFGAPDEIALTRPQFLKELNALLGEYPSLTAKLTGIGQFQVYVGLFARTEV